MEKLTAPGCAVGLEDLKRTLCLVVSESIATTEARGMPGCLKCIYGRLWSGYRLSIRKSMKLGTVPRKIPRPGLHTMPVCITSW